MTVLNRIPEGVLRERSRPRLVVRLAAVAFTLVLCCASAEIFLRTISPWTGRTPRPVDADARDLPVLRDLFDILKPNVRGQFYGRLYESNNDGLRGPDVPIEKGPNTYRVVLLGDSFTNGQGVRYEESYAALLSKRLNDGRDARHFDVINLGLGGLNLHESVRMLIDRGMKYKPDLLIYGYTVNDIEGPFYRTSRKQGPLQWTSPSRIVNLLGDQWSYFRDIFWHAPGSYLWELDDNYFRNPPAWDYWKTDFRNLRRIANENGICLVVLLHAELTALHSLYPYRPYYEAVSEVARATGTPVIDSFPYFQSRNPRDLWVNAFDYHPNPAGHEILTRALAEGLKDIPEKCWRGHPPSTLTSPGA